MADIIIIAILVIIVFFILKSQLGKLRRGECSGGCAGCSGCHSGGCGKTGCHSKIKTEAREEISG